jgi:hypothetical protein
MKNGEARDLDELLVELRSRQRAAVPIELGLAK